MSSTYRPGYKWGEYRHMGAHGVIEAPAGEDHLWVMAHGLSFVGKVVGVHAPS